MDRNKMPKMGKRQIKIIASVVIVAVVATIALALSIPKNKNSGQPPKGNDAKPANSLTAGGVPVPLQWQAKAKKLGYYCPSWNKQGGQVSSTVCLKLDR